MKNTIKIARLIVFIAIIGFSAAACGGGSFKLTGMPPENNGKYAIVYAVTLDAKVVLIGIQDVNKSAKSVTLARISNGSVTVPMWKADKAGNMVRYSGNDTVNAILVGIHKTEKLDSTDPAVLLKGMAGATSFMGSTKFTNGSAAKVWKEGLGGGLFGGQGFGDLFKGLK